MINEVIKVGIYLNPSNDLFKEALRSKIYVDKSGLISYVNSVIQTTQKYLCVSRPRRFGKTIAANMLAAYYSRGCDSKELFDGLNISKDNTFEAHLNRYNVLFLNIQFFLSGKGGIKGAISRIQTNVLKEILKEYPDIDYYNKKDLAGSLENVYDACKIPFILIIDEWDCVFREYKENLKAQKTYLDFLKHLLKDRVYIGLTYMTGILPIKKYGSHSALNMFDEFTMPNPGQLAEYVGFTQDEVQSLCERYHMDYDEMARWYNGYKSLGIPAVYNPRAVVASLLSGVFDNYWNKTESYEALKIYIDMNLDGLYDIIVQLLAGGKKEIDTGSFQNDMVTFKTCDDVLTLLIHLGYLGFDFYTKEAFIPNKEITDEFVISVKSAHWGAVVRAINSSEELLEATWRRDEEAVAFNVETVHNETSILTYNNETALSYTVQLAYYSAREYYTLVREMPAGKGFADIVFIPRKNHTDKPAMVIELKWEQSAASAIEQIRNKNYPEVLKNYQDNVLLVGIAYDSASKKHSCLIETA